MRSMEPGDLEVDCPFEPELSRLEPELRARVSFDPQTTRLVLRGEASSAALHALRDCHPNELRWQMAVDRLAALARKRGGAAPGSSRFPSTPWGLLLGELETRENEHWLRFMELYRRPIGKSIAKALGWLGRRETSPAPELADEFFSWFFDKKVYVNLRRVGAAGRVNRFRGYLRRCIGTFLKEQTRPPLAADVDAIAAAEDIVARAIDEEVCRDALQTELAALRSAEPDVWRALLYDFKRLSLEDVARRVGVSVATAHRARKRARGVLKERLIRHRLRDGVATEEEAADEWAELFPVLSRVVEEIAAGEPLDDGVTPGSA